METGTCGDCHDRTAERNTANNEADESFSPSPRH
jgi:hypothetical protein